MGEVWIEKKKNRAMQGIMVHLGQIWNRFHHPTSLYAAMGMLCGYENKGSRIIQDIGSASSTFFIMRYPGGVSVIDDRPGCRLLLPSAVSFRTGYAPFLLPLSKRVRTLIVSCSFLSNVPFLFALTHLPVSSPERVARRHVGLAWTQRGLRATATTRTDWLAAK